MSKRLKLYYRLTKPGIIYGNLVSVLGAFLYGSIQRIDIITLFGVLVSTALVIGSGCVINNYLDQDIDKEMKRTKGRSLITGEISGRNALIFAAIIGGTGLALLYATTNSLTTAIGLTAFVSYAIIYTYAKKATVHATLIGTIPGALPAVAGYTAATDRIDASAFALFFILFAWQMVHFYAISLFRIDEYKNAKVPVMPVKHGIKATKLQMLIYGLIFILAILSLRIYGYAGLIYVAIMLPLSIWWLIVILRGQGKKRDDKWARKVFGMSLIILLAFNISLALNAWTP